jgi:hypothetical protein
MLDQVYDRAGYSVVIDYKGTHSSPVRICNPLRSSYVFLLCHL